MAIKKYITSDLNDLDTQLFNLCKYSHRCQLFGEMEVFQVLGTRCINTSFTLSQEEAEMSVSDVFILLGQENELEAE